MHNGIFKIGGTMGSWRVFFPVGKMFLTTLGFFMLLACDNENAPDCLQTSGKIVREEVAISDFTKITVFENIVLILKQGPETKVEVETGEFLREEVKLSVAGDRLILSNGNACNFFREYGITKIYVIAPNITEIRSSTGFPIKSDGVLAYTNLNLISENFLNPETQTTDGEFDLMLNTERVNIVVNGIAYFKLQGNVTHLDINIASGDSRIEAENLISENVIINHRGSNDILIRPQLSLKGLVRGTGDVLSFNRPDEVDVEVLYTGRLVFR